MKVKELQKFFENRIPRELSCDWDNDGLMCASDLNKDIKKVLLCLDANEYMVDLAIEGGFDAIFSHHPIIFRGEKSLYRETGVSGKLIKLIKNDIAVFSYHTRFDALDGGVNDKLAELFELQNVEKIVAEGSPIGRVGYLKEEMALEDFCRLVKEKLGCAYVNYGKHTGRVHRLALVGGGGDSFCSDARASGADTYLTGAMNYHTLSDALMNEMNLVEAGHYFTENPALEALAEIIREADSEIEITFAQSNTIYTV